MSKEASPLIGAAYDSLKIVIERTAGQKDNFMSDAILQDATLMRLMDAGEQLARVRDNFLEYYEGHSSPNWDKLIGLRNIIAHGYLAIDFETIWTIITDRLPDVISELETLI